MVGEFVAHDSKPPVLELESRAMTDLNMSGLAHPRPQVRFRGEADMDRHAKSAGSVENDPKGQLAGCANLPIGCRVPNLGADMWRREFITLIGAAAVWPLAARAQQAGKVPQVGLLDPGISHLFEAFRQGIRDLGYFEAHNISYV